MATFNVSIGQDTLFTGIGVSRGADAVLAKAAAVQRDVAGSVLAALAGAGRSLGGADLAGLLRETPLIRLCTSLGDTTLLLRTGSAVGLLVTPELLPRARLMLERLALPVELAVPIDNPEHGGAEEQIRAAVLHCLDLGARSLAICLCGPGDVAGAEAKVQAMIERLYPPHLLGAVMIMSAAASAAGHSDEERLEAVAVDGYVRRALARHVGEVQGALTAAGFRGTLLVAEGGGGLAPVARVRPARMAQTAMAALEVAVQRWLERAGLQRGIALRVGSVASEVCFVDRCRGVGSSTGPQLTHRLPGGIASSLQRQSGRFVLAPPPSLPAPGPACFGWGGRAPTLADALLVMGYLGPHSLGAAGRPLDVAAARDALAALVGGGAGGVEAVAWRAVRDVVDDLAAALRRRLEPVAGGAPPAFLACGRTGGLLACAVAERLGWSEVHTVYGGGLILTMGAAAMDVVQEFRSPVPPGTVPSALAQLLPDLLRRAHRTLAAARLGDLPAKRQVQVAWQGPMGTGKTDWPWSGAGSSAADLPKEADLALPAGALPGCLSLKVRVALPDPYASFTGAVELSGGAPVAAPSRAVVMGSRHSRVEVGVRTTTDLTPGTQVLGPQLLEAVDAVHWVPPGWCYIVESDGLCRLLWRDRHASADYRESGR